MDGLGGERIIDIGEGDELCGQEQSFQSWAQGVFKVSSTNRMLVLIYFIL